ncbi:MAG: hypothetical protein NC923_05780 [Candidatus Omnitrophica bacterium]|nr:hypothetical protein [Candidatus Omnitrophota bacterium]
MNYELYKIGIFAAITFLIIWIIFRVNRALRKMVKDEIYNVFPSIKAEIDNLSQRINYLKTEIESIENRIKAQKA